MPNTIRLEISYADFKDETVIRFIKDATPQYDGEFDAIKLSGNSDIIPFIYSFTQEDSLNLAINSLTEINENTIIPLGVKTSGAGEYGYKISITELILPENTIAYLIDNKLNRSIDLNKNKEYVFTNLSANDRNRFQIIFEKKQTTETESIYKNEPSIYSNFNNIFIIVGKDYLNSMIEIYNILGQKVYQNKINSTFTKISSNFATGTYIVRLRKDNEIVVKKVIINTN